MESLEYCELWWAEGNNPRLTFYKPTGTETVSIDDSDEKEDSDSWDSLAGAIVQLGLSGWELVSASHHGAGLFFKRYLQ